MPVAAASLVKRTCSLPDEASSWQDFYAAPHNRNVELSGGIGGQRVGPEALWLPYFRLGEIG